jgi:hypothetical protein
MISTKSQNRQNLGMESSLPQIVNAFQQICRRRVCAKAKIDVLLFEKENLNKVESKRFVICQLKFAVKKN